jgi:hypothetical protein
LHPELNMNGQTLPILMFSSCLTTGGPIGIIS